MSPGPPDRRAVDRYISTGELPRPPAVAHLVHDAYRMFGGVDDGTVSDVYPALARGDPESFGLCVASSDGTTYEAGDSRMPFTIMSVAKPLVFALVCQQVGTDAVRDLVGVNATGLPFNSVQAVDRSERGRTNPMVNSRAIATVSLVPGDSPESRWRFIVDGLSRFAGRALSLDDGGVCPVSQERVIAPDVARATLAMMAIAGLYETSGDWLVDVGVPGKSGIGGGIVTVSPGKGALGTFSPRLDPAGNSVRGQLAARFLAQQLGLDLLASQPVQPAVPRV